MRPVPKRFFLFLVIVQMATPWGGNAWAAKNFVYCSEGSPSIFNPQLATDGTTFNASSRAIYDRLVEFKQGSTQITGGLAHKWKISKDGREVEFLLRQGVRFHHTKYFHPKRDFNADDVIFTFNRMRDPEHPYHKVSGGTYVYFNSMEMSQLIKEIKKTGDYSVKFVLTRREAPFLANMAMDFASILSAEYATKLLKEGRVEDLDWKPIGTGPFRFKKYKKDTSIRFEAHPFYFNGVAAIENLIFAITTDSSVRTQKLKAGECDFIAEPSHIDLRELKSHATVKVHEREGLNVGYIAMNVEKKPFDNIYVRQAINHALNKTSYIKAIYQNTATVAKNPLPPSLWSYHQGIRDYKYDPARAKDLLVKAGYPKGFETELWVLPVARPYNPNGKKMGELVQADLARIGIRLKLVQLDWPTYLAKSRQGEHTMIQLGWTGDNGDPDNFLRVLLSCSAVSTGANRARWCDPDFSRLIEKGKASSAVKQRTQLYRLAQERFKSQAPWVPLAHAKIFRAMRKNVVGYKIDPFGRDFFHQVDKKE